MVAMRAFGSLYIEENCGMVLAYIIASFAMVFGAWDKADAIMSAINPKYHSKPC